ncbi:hypothetical protein ACN2XU_22770 [Primorskyibacter sp. 2E107]|uniref:hypothetical protein n=1 Tax=Primorskyibacter sp. 2E107 TaxID=3403458 RepID=UPI003AF7F1A0
MSRSTETRMMGAFRQSVCGISSATFDKRRATYALATKGAGAMKPSHPRSRAHSLTSGSATSASKAVEDTAVDQLHALKGVVYFSVSDYAGRMDDDLFDVLGGADQ